MTDPVLITLAQGLGTKNLQDWLTTNVVPVLLLLVGVVAFWLGGGKGDNAAVMVRVGGVLIGLVLIGFAVTGGGVALGRWLAGLLSG